jgi:hypothetical protein
VIIAEKTNYRAACSYLTSSAFDNKPFSCRFLSACNCDAASASARLAVSYASTLPCPIISHRPTHFSSFDFTNGTLALTSLPARFMAAAAAAARASSGRDSAGAAGAGAADVEAAMGRGAVAGADAGVEEDFERRRRDMANLDVAAPALLREGPAAAVGWGVPVRDGLGVQLCEVVCRCGGQKEWLQLCGCQ